VGKLLSNQLGGMRSPPGAMGGERASPQALAQLYQLARLNGDFCGLLAGKCESNQWGAMTKRL